MAEKVIRKLLDDMEQDEVEADGTVTFGLDGKDYEIDLSHRNATKLRGHLQPFIEAARAAGTPPRVRRASNHKSNHTHNGASGYNTQQLKAIREWARRNGYPDLGSKGRIPASIITAFESSKSAHGGLFSAS